MNAPTTERYPYLRLITDAGTVVAGSVAVVIFLAGSLSSCRMGGIGIPISILITAALAWIAYIAVMARIEAVRAILQIEDDVRELLARGRDQAATPEKPPA